MTQKKHWGELADKDEDQIDAEEEDEDFESSEELVDDDDEEVSDDLQPQPNFADDDVFAVPTAKYTKPSFEDLKSGISSLISGS